jgi:hypothetical protein
VGLKIFNQLATEMNQPTPGRSLTLHRKTAVSFRDTSLFHIFPVALTCLKQLQGACRAWCRRQYLLHPPSASSPLLPASCEPKCA